MSKEEYFTKIIKDNYPFLLFVLFLIAATYSNSLHGDFMILDDYNNVVINESIKSIGSAIKTFKFINIQYAILYKIGGLNPLYWHLSSLFVHMCNVLLGFLLLAKIPLLQTNPLPQTSPLLQTSPLSKTNTVTKSKHSTKKQRKNTKPNKPKKTQSTNLLIPKIATLIFAVHPVTSEAVNWISGRNYLHFTFIILVTTLLYIKHLNAKKAIYYYISLEFFLIAVMFNRHPYLIITPVFIFLIEQLFHKKITFTNAKKVLLYFVPIALFIVPFIFSDLSSRVGTTLSTTQGTQITRYNQEALTPIIQGYPFTIYSMLKLYTFPRTLTVYYDGNPLTTKDYILMYSIFLLVLAAVTYTLKQNKKIGIIILLIFTTMAPSFSPIKVTWFIAERHLYFGTIFFGTLVALFINYLLNRFQPYVNENKILAFSLILLILPYSIRTYIRNKDWQNNITLSKATIKTSPQTPRPYNDLGVYYLYNKDFETGFYYHSEALKIRKRSNRAMKNMGLMYLEHGTELAKYRNGYEPPFPQQELEKRGDVYVQSGDLPLGIFFYMEALRLQENQSLRDNLENRGLGEKVENIYKLVGEQK